MVDMSEPDYMIHGQVLDQDDRPVRDVRALVYDWQTSRATCTTEPRLIEARTNDEGEFQLGPMPRRGWHRPTIWLDTSACSAAGKDLARHRIEDLPSLRSPIVDLGRILLAPGCRISGQLLDAQGLPIEGAEVRVEHSYHQRCHSVTRNGPDLECSTDVDGRFLTPALPPGLVEVSITASGHPRASRSLSTLPQERIHDLGEIRLPAHPIEIAGRVLDEDGEPIEGVSIHANDDRTHESLTDRDGRFHLEAWDERVGSVSAHMDGYRGYGFYIDDEDLLDLRFELERSHYLCGQVRDEDTHEPVKIDRLLLLQVARSPDGEISLFG